VSWADYGRLLDGSADVARLLDHYGLSTRYLYGLLDLVEMAETLSERPENARWRAHFVYRTYRLLERARVAKDERPRALAELADAVVDRGIEQFRGAYRIALFNHLYQQRD